MKSEVYALAINQNQNWENPDNLYESAMIVKKDTGEKVISVFYCKRAYQKLGYHFGVFKLEDGEIAIIHDDLYLGLSNTNDRAFEAMLMHETGHFINGDFDEQIDNAEIKNRRKNAVLSNSVDPKELAADQFAVEHCGKNAVMQMLDYLIATRRKRNTADGKDAIKEMELRKQAVKRL